MALNVYFQGEAAEIGAFDGDTTIDEIGGEDVSSDHVEVYELSYGTRVSAEAQSAHASAHRRVQPLRFMKRLDQSTPAFYQACAENKTVSGTFKIFDTDRESGVTRLRHTVTITGARVIAVETKSPDAFDADESNRPVYDVIELVPNTVTYSDAVESKEYEDSWSRSV